MLFGIVWPEFGKVRSQYIYIYVISSFFCLFRDIVECQV